MDVFKCLSFKTTGSETVSSQQITGYWAQQTPTKLQIDLVALETLGFYFALHEYSFFVLLTFLLSIEHCV